MENIKVIIMCAGSEEFPRCRDLLESCPAVSVMAQPENMSGEGALAALGRSDILILDEAALEQDDLDSVRGLLAGQPPVKSLLIVDNFSRNMVLSALSLGVRGVIERDSLFAELTRALTAIYIGEAWVSRMLVEPIRDELIYRDKMALWAGHLPGRPDRNRMN